MSVFLIISLLFVQPIVFGYEMTRETCTQGLTPDLNVKDSLILSAMTVCVPGMLEKVNEYRQIKCEEVVCTYEALKNGLDPSFCARQAGYNTCKYVTGEVFSMPWANFAESIREGIAQYLANPYSAVITGFRTATSQCSGACDTIVMQGMSLTLAINDLAAFAQRVTDLVDNGLEGIETQNYCEDIDKIEKEVDSILDSTNY